MSPGPSGFDTGCPVQKFISTTLDFCDRLGIKEPGARATYVASKLGAVGDPFMTSAAALVLRLVGTARE